MRAVLDTNVIVAAMRSPSGASARLLSAARNGVLVPVGTLALALEYEATCLSPEHVRASGLTEHEARAFVAGVIALVDPVVVHYIWRPQVRDPGDEMVLEAAVNGRAAALVTFNRRDFVPVAERFGIDVLSPRDAFLRITT
jgi:putative PIN family toxin of toxin-antitoxin system